MGHRGACRAPARGRLEHYGATHAKKEICAAAYFMNGFAVALLGFLTSCSGQKSYHDQAEPMGMEDFLPPLDDAVVA